MAEPVPPTSFPELDGVLAALVAGVRAALPGNLCGVYLVGSFAIGEADEHSDVDFLVATERELSVVEQRALQELHGRLFDLPVSWAQHLEGSYAPAPALRAPDPARRPFFYLDNGARALDWDPHCNTAVVRWTLREHGVVLAGAAPGTIVDPVRPDDLCAEARRRLRETAAWAAEAAGTLTRWEQPYIVLSCCRMRHTLEHGRIVSKREAGSWALDAFDARWRPLIRAALDDRAAPWERARQPASAEASAETAAFAAAAAENLLDVTAAGRARPGSEHGETGPESELHRRLRLLRRRFSLFDSSRKTVAPQGNASGPPVDSKTGARRG